MVSENSNEVVEIESLSATAEHDTAGDDSLAAALGLNVNQFAWQLFNFAVVAVIVWFMILKPLVKKMEERQKMVEESVDNAKRIESNLLMSEQKFQEKIDEAKVEANQLIGKAQDEADSLAEKMKEKAQADVQELIKQAKEKIGEEKEKMSKELRAETAGLVVAALEKILGQKVDDTTDKKIIEDTLKKL